MNNKRKLRILNPAEMHPLTGGAELSYKCNKAGNTIICGIGADMTACLHFEGTCSSQFSSGCSIFSSITINCPSGFTISK